MSVSSSNTFNRVLGGRTLLRAQRLSCESSRYRSRCGAYITMLHCVGVAHNVNAVDTCALNVYTEELESICSHVHASMAAKGRGVVASGGIFKQRVHAPIITRRVRSILVRSSAEVVGAVASIGRLPCRPTGRGNKQKSTNVCQA